MLESMTLMLILCLLSALASGVRCGRLLTVAQHQGVRRKVPEITLLHGGVTLLTVLYGLFMHAGLLWTAIMLVSSALGLTLGQWWTQKNPPRELSVSQLRTDAILER